MADYSVQNSENISLLFGATVEPFLPTTINGFGG